MKLQQHVMWSTKAGRAWGMRSSPSSWRTMVLTCGGLSNAHCQCGTPGASGPSQGASGGTITRRCLRLDSLRE